MSKSRGYPMLLLAGFLGAIYGLGAVQAAIELRAGLRPQALDVFRQMPAVASLRAYEEDLRDASWFACRIRPCMQYAMYVVLSDTGAKAVEGREGWWFYQPGVRYLIEPLQAEGPGAGLAEVRSAIVSFRDQLAERGIRLLVVPVPGKASVYPSKLTTWAGPGCLKQTHTRRLMQELGEAGVAVVNLLDAFDRPREQEALPDAEAFYLVRDTHWTPAGVDLAAGQIARRVRESGWAQEGDTVYMTRPVTIERPGDIVRMLRSAPVERLFEAQQVVCQQVIRADSGEPYRDDERSRILILGDSFLRMYQHDEPGSAGLIAHLARELGQPLSSVVNDGGASTLVRQELARRPDLLAGKTLVIWEFVERDIRFGLNGWQQVPLPAP